MDITELETHYFKKKLDGMDYSEIRKELRQRGFPEEEIVFFIRSIDNKILAGINSKEDKITVNTSVITGIFLIVGGLLVSFGTYYGWIDMGEYYILAYGPVLSGVGLLFVSRKKRSNMFDRKRKF